MINDALHVLAGSIWLGSLILLPGCLALLDHPELYQDARSALQRFSRIGHAVVAAVILTGAVNSVLTLPHWPTRPISPYVALLGLKIILVAAMATVAVINRYVFVPSIQMATIDWRSSCAPDPTDQSGPPIAHAPNPTRVNAYR